MPLQAVHGRHDHAGRADAALRRAMGEEGGGQAGVLSPSGPSPSMVSTRASLGLRGRHEAGADLRAVEQHGAGAAIAGAAAELGAGGGRSRSRSVSASGAKGSAVTVRSSPLTVSAMPGLRDAPASGGPPLRCGGEMLDEVAHQHQRRLPAVGGGGADIVDGRQAVEHGGRDEAARPARPSRRPARPPPPEAAAPQPSRRRPRCGPRRCAHPGAASSTPGHGDDEDDSCAPPASGKRRADRGRPAAAAR